MLDMFIVKVNIASRLTSET